MRVPRRRESIFLRIAESKNNVDGRLSEQLSAQALVLLSCRSDRKAHALDFTDAVAVGRGKAFARLVHGVENGLEHGVLVVSAGFVHERVDLQIGAALEKADEFKRQNDGDGGNSCSSIKAGAARHADGGNDPDACRAREATDAAAIVNDESGAEKADALHDIGSDLTLVWTVVASQHGREKSEKGRAHADEEVGANSGGCAFCLSLQAHEAAEETRQKQASHGAVDDADLLNPGEVER